METYTKPQQVASSVIEELEHTTDLPLFDRKTVAYYIVGTHAVWCFDAYPILVLLGETNTGKNAIIWAIRRCGHKTREPLILRGTTMPVLRDYLIETRNAVAILDEADSMMGNMDFEELIKCRSRKETGQLVLNRQDEGGKGYHRESKNIYGALIVHRQAPFRSPSLVTRCITVQTKSNVNRLYTKPSRKCSRIELGIELKEVELEGAPRIAENWSPLAAVAEYLGDSDFLVEIVNRLAIESTELIEEAQAAEPMQLIMDGALALSFTKDKEWRASVKGRWRLSELSRWLMDEHSLSMNPWQIGKVLRGRGLKTVKSNGSYVADFSPAELLKVMNGSHDEAVADLEALVNKQSTKSTRSTQGAPLKGFSSGDS